MRFWFPLLLGAAAVPVAAAPLPPPSETEQQTWDSFFTAMPSRLPVSDFKKLEPLVAEDLVVYFNHDKRFNSREEWFQWLNAMAVENGVERTHMDRDMFFQQSNGRILVRELWEPYTGGRVYHPWYPAKMVSYKFNGNMLVQVDYLAEFEPHQMSPGGKSDG